MGETLSPDPRDACAIHSCELSLISCSSSFSNLSEAFDTNAATTMSVCDERQRKVDWIEVARALTPASFPPLYYWLAHFRQWHLDANDGAKLGDERAYQQGNPARSGKFRCRSPGACACSCGRFAGRSAGQTQNS